MARKRYYVYRFPFAGVGGRTVNGWRIRDRRTGNVALGTKGEKGSVGGYENKRTAEAVAAGLNRAWEESQEN